MAATNTANGTWVACHLGLTQVRTRGQESRWVSTTKGHRITAPHMLDALVKPEQKTFSSYT